MDDLIRRADAVEVVDAIWAATGDMNVAKAWDQIKDLPSAQPEIIRCKDCKHFHLDTWGYDIGLERGHILYNLIVGHETCDRWSEGHNQVCEDGYCFLAERRE